MESEWDIVVGVIKEVSKEINENEDDGYGVNKDSPVKMVLINISFFYL